VTLRLLDMCQMLIVVSVRREAINDLFAKYSKPPVA
jgi:hypothetical protein